MGIDFDVFTQWIVVLSERFKQPLSIATQSMYYDRLSPRLSTEQFIASAESLFDSDADRLPGIEEWAKLARTLVPDRALPAAPETPPFEELPPEQQQAWLEAKEAARKLAIAGATSSPWKSRVFASVGASVQVPGLPVVIPEKTLADELKQKNQWLHSGDRILKNEAIAWVNGCDLVEMEFDDQGNPVAIVESVEAF